MRPEVFYFSGTGNTEILAERFAYNIAGGDPSYKPKKIEDFVHVGFVPQLTGGQMVALLYPIYAFDAPEIVYDFVDLLPVDPGLRIALIKVGCDTIWLNVAASHFLKKKNL